MRKAVNCKFCHNPITVEIDDDYAALGDPFKLVSFACCNRCADLREERRLVTDRIRKVAMAYASVTKKTDATKQATRNSLLKLCQQYARLVAAFHGKEGSAFDEASVDLMLEQPHKWGEILSRYWKMYREWEAQERVKESEAALML